MTHLAFALEQTLGHVTHGDNLRRIVGGDPAVDSTFLLVEPAMGPRAARVPGWSNWTVRAGIRARRLVRAAHRTRPIDAMFVHTQVPAVLLGRWMRRVPTVVSLDATPQQYDELGEFYAHEVGSARVEQWKKMANQRCFARARHLVAWSTWTKDALVADYGVPAAKITVIPPGVDVGLWDRAPRTAAVPDAPVRILFVGGDLARKGGDRLIAAVRALRADPALPPIELHLVTRSEVADEPGVHVHRLGPNSPELIALYHECDVFSLPTLGDCLPMVLSEAGVAGMALVSTAVGAIHEIVRDGETGLLIAPGDTAALEVALRRLVSDPALRLQLGRAAAELVRRDYDATINAARLVHLVSAVAGRGAAP